MGFEEDFKKLQDAGFLEFVTFHPSYSYEEFVEGYKPSDGGGFKLKDGIFKRMCYYALDRLLAEYEGRKWQKPENIEKVKDKWQKLSDVDKMKILSHENVKKVLAERDGKFVLIIDEINRANISKVMGELIYALEYRGKPVKLLYSREDLVVPPNLYVIGTMNTADKSIALVDIALRRRFGFQEFMPEIERFYEIVEEASSEDGIEIRKEEIKKGLNGLDLPRLLETINKRIVILADREKQIGHSYFLNVFKDENGKYIKNTDLWKKNLRRIWFNEIIPLLQEYFYNDYEKIKAVIGKAFVEEVKKPKLEHEPEGYYEDEIKRFEISRELDKDRQESKLIKELIKISEGK